MTHSQEPANRDFASMVQRANHVRRLYDEENARLARPAWGPAEYLQGLTGDLGALARLIMSRNGFREAVNIDQRLAHELADCLWSVIVLADALEIDLESAFESTMTLLETRLS